MPNARFDDCHYGVCSQGETRYHQLQLVDGTIVSATLHGDEHFRITRFSTALR